MRTKEPKPKSCKVCGEQFIPRSSTQKACSVSCAYEIVRQTKVKKERADDRIKKLNLKTRREWLADAQISFNAYIRERDKAQPCICCGKELARDAVGGGYDCGHYRSVGSAPHLRFNEDNAHGQRKVCNRYGGGRAVDYRIGLIKRIGLARVEVLEADNEPKKWDIEQLKEIKQYYNQKLKQLRK